MNYHVINIEAFYENPSFSHWIKKNAGHGLPTYYDQSLPVTYDFFFLGYIQSTELISSEIEPCVFQKGMPENCYVLLLERLKNDGLEDGKYMFRVCV